MFNRTFTTGINAAIALTLAAGAAYGGVADYRIVAETGDVATGSSGGVFTGFGVPRINSSGKVAFAATTTAQLGSSGIWHSLTDNPQAVDMIAGADLFPPDAPQGVRFGEFDFAFYHPIVNDDNEIGFSAPLTGIDLSEWTDVGLYRWTNGALEKEVMVGDPVNGAAGLHYKGFGNLIGFNAAGQFVARAYLDGPGVTEDNDVAVVANTFGGLKMFAREGAGAFGMPGTIIENLLYLGVPQINDAGSVFFNAELSGAVDATHSVWSGYPGLLTCHAKNGDVSPIGDPFGGGYFDFWGGTQTAHGPVFTKATMQGDQTTLGHWFANDGDLQTVTRRNTFGPLGVIKGLDSESLTANADGDTVYWARFEWFDIDESNDTAVLRKNVNGDPEVIFQEGEPAYGYGAGVVFDDFDGLSSYTTLAIDDEERVYIKAKVRGLGITNDNDYGLWSVDRFGNVTFIMREGLLIDQEGPGYRIVDNFTFNASVGMQAGRRPGVNNRGDIAIRVNFTNGDQVIMVAQQPIDCPGDVNGDGFVNFDDLNLVLAYWSQTGPVGQQGDADFDGDSDFDDLNMVLENWANACNPM